MRGYLGLVVLVLAATVAVATADVKHVTRAQIDNMEGVVHMAMPCNWNKTQPVALKGEPRTPTASTTAISGGYLVITLPAEDRTELDLLTVEFAVTRKDCRDGGTWKSFTR